jgi:hypothetical protein
LKRNSIFHNYDQEYTCKMNRNITALVLPPGRVEARSIFDLYDDLKSIGAGAFGQVFSAKRNHASASGADKMVAIKVITIRGKSLKERELNLKQAQRERLSWRVRFNAT